MNKVIGLVLAVMLLIPGIAYSADSARNVGETGYLDGANAIADISSANCAEVDDNGNLAVAATTAMTLVRKESSQALGTGALSYTTNFAAKTKVKQIIFKAASAITQTVTFSFDSKTNATYDATLASEDLVAEQSYTYMPADMILESGDEIVIGCTNSGTPAILVYCTIIGETLS